MRKRKKTLAVYVKDKASLKKQGEQVDDSGSFSSSSSGGETRRKPAGGGAWSEYVDSSFLAEETRTMERERRTQEQQGHRKHARVNAREHAEQEQKNAPEGELQNSILQNPWLDSQRFDGVDPNLNPEPPLNTEARREFDNARREQEMEKQLRLGHMPKMGTAPKPQGP